MSRVLYPAPPEPKREPMRRAAQSFLAREITATVQLFDIARRGGDLGALLRSADLASVERKFRRMVPRTSGGKVVSGG